MDFRPAVQVWAALYGASALVRACAWGSQRLGWMRPAEAEAEAAVTPLPKQLEFDTLHSEA